MQDRDDVVHNKIDLKGLEHSILGWKVHVNINNNLHMSLSEEMSCWLLRIFWWKMHENWGKSFFHPMDKKIISPHIEWCIGKCPGFCTIFLKTSTWYLSFFFVTRVSYFSGIRFFLLHFYAQTLLWGFIVVSP